MKHKTISVTGKLLLFLLSYCLFSKTVSAQTPNANSFSSYVAYNGTYRYGANPGYYGSNWNAENIATLAMGNASLGVKGAGVHSLRVPLYDDFLSQWGLTTELSKFQNYTSMGGGDFTAFIGSPSAAHREPTTFPGSPEQAKTFKGIYEPIWLDAAQTQVNPNNTYATYLYNVVKTYGQYIKFWEVVNEPDFTYSPAGWSGDTNPPTPGSWYDHNPTPAELENLRAPIFYYIRTLRISWEIIKKLSPSSYVCTGGIGYRSFLDAILRNTDNPAGGSVTADYPQKGGAYFDVLSYHCYPMYNIPKTWDNTTASVVQIRHSDAATDAYVNVKKTMDNVLASYGYNNSQFPQKQFICTETGASRIMSGADWGGNEGQKNYMIKAQVASQKAGIKQVYWFQVGDGTNTTAQFDQMGLYTYFGNTSPYYNITKSDQGIAMKTTSDQLYGSTFDVARTYAMALPAGVDGGAFRKNDGSYVYVLWARTTIDLSETASATYSFPSSVVLGSTVDRKEWNYSETNAVSTVPKTGIALTGSPSFFSESGSSAILPPSTGSSGTTTRIQAENWTAMSGVATENAWGDPTGGGLDVGWIDPNDWMDYGFNAPSAGTYTVNFRVASAANGAQFQLKNASGTVLTTVNVPNTGGWQTWQTISATVTLPAGQQTIRLQSSSTPGAVFNINWLEFVGGSGAATPPPTTTGSTTTRIQAENYLGMNGVNTENAWGDPTGGGLDVGWIDPNDWMDYGFNAPSAGTYTVNFRIASAANGAQFQLKNASGTVLTTVNVPNTGGWQTWQTISATVTLPAGQQTIRLQSSSTPGAVFNINWLEFVGGSGTATPPPTTTGSTTTRIQAENYLGMNGVNTENAWGDPTGGGLDVGWIDPNDWMDYGFNAPSAGTYTVNFRIASAANGAQFQLKNASGTVLTTVNVPNTGGWQTWQTISATVTLPAGQQTIRLQSSSTPGAVFNINWLEFVGGSGTTTPTTTGSTTTRIQAENYLGMNGVNTENAWGDPTGGGLDVGWIDPNDWMDYGFNAPSAGTYTVNFRIASAANGAQFQLKNASGSVLTTVNVPNTGGWQTWQTISATVTLPAGQQTIRLFCTSTPGTVFNINWLEFVSGSSLTAMVQKSSSLMTTDSTASTSAGLDVFPNPVTDRFALQVNNNLTGTMTVQILDLKGAVQKQFTLTKAAAGTAQFYLSIGDLAAANYVVKAIMGNWSQTKQIVKQ